MVAGWFGGAWEWDGDGFVMVRVMLEDGSVMVWRCLGIVWSGRAWFRGGSRMFGYISEMVW